MPYPLLSISETTTHPASFEEDVDAYSGAGLDGIGIWEYKLPDGQDERIKERLQEAKLKASVCVPRVPSVIAEPFFPDPQDPIARRKELCKAIRRLALFEPESIMVLTGPPGEDSARARRTVVEGLRAAADVAGEIGITLGLEPYRKTSGSLITTLPETAELIDEIGAPNVRIIYDTWHFWDIPNVLEHLRTYVDQLVCIQLNDWREPTRSWADRLLPGDGIIDLPAILATLDDAGFKGWYDVEVFSDNGLFGNAYPDSIWNIEPAEVARLSKLKFRALWDKRQLPAS
jgi:sugar phosphate isomerase/epimerase